MFKKFPLKDLTEQAAQDFRVVEMQRFCGAMERNCQEKKTAEKWMSDLSPYPEEKFGQVLLST